MPSRLPASLEPDPKQDAPDEAGAIGARVWQAAGGGLEHCAREWGGRIL